MHPVKPDTLVTPIDGEHPWFSQELRVTQESESGLHVLVQRAHGQRPFTNRLMKKVDLAVIYENTAIAIARAIGKQRGRRKHGH